MNQSVESAPPVDNDIIEIIPMEEYDSNKVPQLCLMCCAVDVFHVSS